MLLPWFSGGELFANWSRPVTVSSSHADSPQIALDEEGNAPTVWKRLIGVHTVVEEVTGAFGNVWPPPVVLSEDSQDANLPDLAVDPEGNWISVWSRFNGSYQIVQASSSLVGVPVDLSISDGDAIYPSIAAGPVNSFVAVWMKEEGPNYAIQSSRLQSGTWSAPVDIGFSADHLISPKVAVDGSGNAIAVWVIYDGSHYVVQAAVQPVSGSWSSPQDLSSLSLDAFDPQISTDFNGNASVVWQLDDGSSNVIQVVTYSSGSWSPPQSISAVDQNSFVPQIAVDANNNAVVVFENRAGVHSVVQAVNRVGGDWSLPVNLSFGDQNAVNPQVAVDGNGNAVVAWKESITSGSVVQAVLHPFNGNWSSPVAVSTEGQDSEVPDLAMNARGDAILTWRNNFLTQIQVSRGGFFVAPPSNYFGRIQKSKFLNKTEYVLSQEWSGSLSTNAAYYLIYKNDQVVGKVSDHGKHVFYAKFDPQANDVDYKIVAFSQEGFESAPVNIRIIRE